VHEVLLEFHGKEGLYFAQNFCLDKQHHISSASFRNFGCETGGMTDRRTDTPSPLCVTFMHFAQQHILINNTGNLW
jgi:hypothetical protein